MKTTDSLEFSASLNRICCLLSLLKYKWVEPLPAECRGWKSLIHTGLIYICPHPPKQQLIIRLHRATSCQPLGSDAYIYLPISAYSPVGQSDGLLVDHWTQMHLYTHPYVYAHLLVNQMDYLLTTGLRCICILTCMCMLTCWSIRQTSC